MPDMYDEYGRLIKKPEKPEKMSPYDAYYPRTFTISIVNNQTAEGVKDWWVEDKLKTAKGAMKKAWKEGSGFMFQPAMPIGVWFREQDWDDLFLVARPITANRDREHYFETGIQVFSFSGSIGMSGMAWNKAWDYMNSPPSEPQLFAYGPGGRALYDNAGYQGESTIIPLVEISG